MAPPQPSTAAAGEEPEDAGLQELLGAIALEEAGPPPSDTHPRYRLLTKVSPVQPRSWQLQPGLQPLQRPLAINADAMAKLIHYLECGMSITAAWERAGLQPQLSVYFGPMRSIVEELQSCAPVASNEQEEGGEHASCDAHLTCARETAKCSGGQLDERNVCGAVCSHGVPVRQLFMSSPAHEHFWQYRAMLALARQFLPELEAVLLDINCQFSKNVEKRMPSVAAGLRFFIGWLHAKAGHNLECQLRFNAMFGDGLGRCFGEGIEQLWAELKPIQRIQRYETLPHRQVTLELALHHVAMSKWERSWELLVQTWRLTVRRKKQLEAELTVLVAKATAEGYSVDASDTFVLAEQVPLKLTPAQQYVKKLAAKATHERLTAGGGAAIAGLDSNAGR
ncbi:hypothetical protein ABPG75_001588 [Micractinium tetrahymenae]